MNKKLLILETHPIQYRAPVFQAYERLFPGEIEVVYASDFSIRGYRDKEFANSISWDTPLLNGYRYRVLNNLRGRGIDHWNGLAADGVGALIRQFRPDAILLHSLNYAFSWAAYINSKRLNIPVWIRVETQDKAFKRSRLKSLARYFAYRLAYAGIDRAFYIGELNREHLERHGISRARLFPARYCTPDPLLALSIEEKAELRRRIRTELAIPESHRVIAFFGKFISKKNPEIVLEAMRALYTGDACAMTCLFVGSGELEDELRRSAAQLAATAGVRTVFAGFINQSALPGYYLASDILVLPSRKAGETWGLVVNEALQAGCAVAASDAVGCMRDFGNWDRVRVFPAGDVAALAKHLKDLSAFERDFTWARSDMQRYSVEETAHAFHNCLMALPKRACETRPTAFEAQR